MKAKIKFLAMFALVATMGLSSIKAQDSIVTSLGTDLVSRYVWRGSPVYEFSTGSSFLSPNFQPTFAVSYKGFTLGAWGSFDFMGAYHETDLYLTYAIGPVALTVTDYNWNYSGRYFDYKSETTPHIIEGSIVGKLGSFTATAAAMLYGADKKFDTTGLATKDNNYSTYLELAYGFKASGTDFTATIGATPYNGFYGAGYKNFPLYSNIKPVEGFGIVNISVSAVKTLSFSDKFGIPVKTSLIINPQLEKAFLVVGLTF
jgi:hypothetical protein